MEDGRGARGSIAGSSLDGLVCDGTCCKVRDARYGGACRRWGGVRGRVSSDPTPFRVVRVVTSLYLHASLPLTPSP